MPHLLGGALTLPDRRPGGPYGVSKLAATELVLGSGLDAVVLRVFSPAGPGTPAGSPLGRLAEAMRRAIAKPDLTVDRLPAPVVAKPAALQRPPRSALNKDGSATINVDVLIDTLGKADMKTFKVVKSSSKWLTENVRSVLPKWRFSPAELAGCKVPRVYHFMASAPPRAAKKG